MQSVLAAIEEWRLRIENHPLHTWVAADDGIDPAQKLYFGAHFINFIMYFRELNLYHISHERDPVQDELRRALSAHAREDMTHSRLFMKDFITLGWDAVLGWSPSAIVHWLFTSKASEGLRRRTSKITALVIGARDPVMKFPVVTAIEACGNALFRHTAVAARRIKEARGRDLVYWGKFHLDREAGFVEGEDLFERVVLTPAERDRAIRAAVRTFELIDEQNTDMLEQAQRVIAAGGYAHVGEGGAVPAASMPVSYAPERLDFHFWPTAPSPSQRPIRELLDRCVAELEGLDVLDAFAYRDLPSAVATMRAVVLSMATDTTGSDTVYKYMVPYEQPATVEERAINRLARRFGQRAHMIYADWHSLDLDRVLGWSPSRTLEFIYLDRVSESHRDLRAVVTRYIDENTEPLLRYWTIVALKSLTHVHGQVFQALAQRIEQELGRALPYFALRPNPDAPALPPDPDADAVRFEALELTGEQRDRAMDIVAGVSAAIRHKLEDMVVMIRSGALEDVAREQVAS